MSSSGASLADLPFSLIFHPVGDPDARRPSTVFADAIRTVLAAAPGEVLLVSPYLGHQVLRGIVRSREFRLITDSDACFEAGGTDQLLRFLTKHNNRVREVSRVHAKVVLTAGAAFMGSANLTEGGLADRDEVGCLIHDPALLANLRGWFDALWSRADAFDASLAASAIHRARSGGALQHAPNLTPLRPIGRRIGPRRSLGWLTSPNGDGSTESSEARRSTANTPETSVDVQSWDGLVARLRRLTRSGKEARMVLDCLAEALAVAELPVGDTRLYVNCRTATALHVNISSLAVAWCNKKRGSAYFGMMLDDRELVKHISETVSGASIEQFKKDSRLGIKVPLDALEGVLPALRDSWHRAIRTQARLTRANGEPYYNTYHNRHHFPFFFEILTTLPMRDGLVLAAFPPGDNEKTS